MKTSPTTEVITAQFQVIDRLNRKGAVPQQEGKQSETTAASAAPAQVHPKDVKQATAEINDALKSLNTHLQFSIDDSSKSIVVKLIDGDTGEVLRQIPADEVLRLRAYYRNHQGLLLNTAV
jgi:flagellar protein FlaG